MDKKEIFSPRVNLFPVLSDPESAINQIIRLAFRAGVNCEEQEVLIEGQWIHLNNLFPPNDIIKGCLLDVSVVVERLGVFGKRVLDYFTGELYNPHSNQIHWSNYLSTKGPPSKGPGKWSRRNANAPEHPRAKDPLYTPSDRIGRGGKRRHSR